MMSLTLTRPRACVFDLDGTLVDSLRDIAEALNTCLELLGVPVYPVAEYRYMVGEGIPVLCRRAIGDRHPHLVSRLAELARAFYRTRFLQHTAPYAGVPELVQSLRDQRLPIAALSNKPHELTAAIVERFWPRPTFARVFGYIEEHLRKPSPHYLLRICSELDVPPAATWMVGDTPTDIQTALAAGCVPIGVTWGFRTRADLAAAGAVRIIDHPHELLA